MLLFPKGLPLGMFYISHVFLQSLVLEYSAPAPPSPVTRNYSLCPLIIIILPEESSSHSSYFTASLHLSFEEFILSCPIHFHWTNFPLYLLLPQYPLTSNAVCSSAERKTNKQGPNEDDKEVDNGKNNNASNKWSFPPLLVLPWIR